MHDVMLSYIHEIEGVQKTVNATCIIYFLFVYIVCYKYLLYLIIIFSFGINKNKTELEIYSALY